MRPIKASLMKICQQLAAQDGKDGLSTRARIAKYERTKLDHPTPHNLLPSVKTTHTTDDSPPTEPLLTHKYTVRVTKDTAAAIDAIRARHGGHPTAICRAALEILKDVRPENWHAALHAFQERGKTP